ncbi:MAG: ribokinase [SAR324 cluster bacterium]|uniref:Carbohydrate kinase PfkB domain-containing protein n=1 Tax=marine metagenome TaxID=408172 RepID=A0A381NTZ6_9ZZZZ|nr:ribokinase [SAR324 cluster bacterium]
MSKSISILGIFVADLTFRTERMPNKGETYIGNSFKLGPGGKGSNQAVAARRAGAETMFITKIGKDTFGEMAMKLYADEGINSKYVWEIPDMSTGAASIVVNEETGDNAIIVVPGAADAMVPDDLDTAEAGIADCAFFMASLEVPIPVMQHGLEVAKRNGVPTILNPAPAAILPDEVYGLSDYFTPNETEAAILAGIPVVTIEDAEEAAKIFLQRGIDTVVITLGEKGAYVRNSVINQHVPAFDMGGKVLETTGAGDAFNGGFAYALAEGMSLIEAVRFGSATAAISVTRLGTAPAMPVNSEIQDLLNK